ncbi:MAG: hypothetical protein FD123_3827 [Bacteroidetes bacterium]|nr:MAG: hypothetical protein FD123_3827 [Bacteroidota bacterium]
MKDPRNENNNRSTTSNPEQGASKNGTVQYPAQFKLKRWKPENEPKSEKEKLGDLGANMVSTAVDVAHEELEKNDLTDASPAYQKVYLLRLKELKDGKKSMHPSTAAGYIIESKVTNRMASEPGFNFQDTDILPGTRPDVTIDLGDDERALVDITAQKSLGHIFNKKGNWGEHKTIPYVAEAWYPSMKFIGEEIKLSPEQIKQAEEAAEEKEDLRMARLREMIQIKTDEFFEVQEEVMSALIDAGKGVALYISENRRRLLPLEKVGIDITIKTVSKKEIVSKLSIPDRNDRIGVAKMVTEESPVPDFEKSRDKDAALSTIKHAKYWVTLYRSKPKRPGKRKRRDMEADDIGDVHIEMGDTSLVE